MVDWQSNRLDKILAKVSEPVQVDPNKLYREIGVRSHGKGVFHKDPIFGSELGSKRVFWVKTDVLVLNIVFAWEQALAVTAETENGFIASHRFPMFLPKNNLCSIQFLKFLFLTKRGKTYLELASPGGAGRNKTLGQKNFDELKVTIPTIDEQTKIANFLTAVDEKIQHLTQKADLLAQYKKGVMQQIFSQELRFKDDDGGEFAEWEEAMLGDVLDYEQPTKYLVSSTEYDDSYETPVLTAGKTFVLGYTDEVNGIFEHGLPVIIFDDFTTAFKFVTFPFKAKSSAMKILKLNSASNNIKFIYEVMGILDLPTGDEHKRYWISEYSKLLFQLPCLKEQTKIATFLTAIDDKITHTQTQLAAVKQYKQGLLQQMFV